MARLKPVDAEGFLFFFFWQRRQGGPWFGLRIGMDNAKLYVWTDLFLPPWKIGSLTSRLSCRSMEAKPVMDPSLPSPKFPP
jgi:hypothetical protein